jgi:RimJ/RimL family protein N-acetyltransferase
LRADMKLLPLDRAELIALVAGWLSKKENFQWLDFGGVRLDQVTPTFVKIMAHGGTSVVRIFTADDDETPIGIVGLNNVDRHFKTASVWVALGDKSFARRGYATRAVSKMITLGFRDLGLGAINTWVVAHNPSAEVARGAGLRYVGRLRQCHHIDGEVCDRLLFDILPSEHTELA